MKKLFITVILAIVCQFTFGNTTFIHENRGWRHHECSTSRPCLRPEIVIAPPRPCMEVRMNHNRGIWVEGHWIITRRGYQKWIPGHWSY